MKHREATRERRIDVGHENAERSQVERDRAAMLSPAGENLRIFTTSQRHRYRRRPATVPSPRQMQQVSGIRKETAKHHHEQTLADARE